MPLSTRDIQLRLVTFSINDSISANPLKTHSVVCNIHNDEPEDVIIKWESNSPNKLKVEPSTAKIPSRETMPFNISIHALDLRNDSPRLHLCCKVVGVRDNEYAAKDIWKYGAYWEETVTTLIHRKYIFIEFEGMLKPGWWKKGKDGKDRVLWGAEADEEDESENEDLFP